MDVKVVEFATKLTEKAMGTDATSIAWIGKEENVAKFLDAVATKLDELYMRQSKRQ